MFDWNGAFFFRPNLPIRYPRTPEHLFPPEAWDNKSAVHASVSSFDVYTIGLLLKRLLKRCCNISHRYFETNHTNTTNIIEPVAAAEAGNTDRDNDNNSNNMLDDDEILAYNLASYMMTANPFERPDTNQALKHPFFTGSSKSQNNIEK